MVDKIKVRGARVHNLKNIDVDIPLNKIVNITPINGIIVNKLSTVRFLLLIK